MIKKLEQRQLISNQQEGELVYNKTTKQLQLFNNGTFNKVLLDGDAPNVDLSSKQDALVSGTNIKTINGTSLLGSGNIAISGGNTNYNIDERNFNDLKSGGTPAGFTTQLQTNSNWNLITDIPVFLNSEDLGNSGRLRGELFPDGKLSMAMRSQSIFYIPSLPNLLKMTFVFNGEWRTELGGFIGLLADTFTFNSVSTLLGRRGVGVYFDTTTQRFICRCRNTLVSEVILNPIPLNLNYLKITITIGNSKTDFEVTHIPFGSSTPVIEAVTINGHIPSFSTTINAVYPTLFFEQIGGVSFINTPMVRRIQLQIL